MNEMKEILARTYQQLLSGQKRARALSDQMGALPAQETGSASCPDGFFSHVIRQGESLITIADKYGITLTELMQYNPNINPYFYTTGQILCIPSASPPSCPQGTLYAIKRGDTFSSIAALYGTTAQAIADANPDVDPDSLIIGQVICIPAREPAPSPTCPGSSDTAYTVQSGDTLVSILTAYQVSYAALSANNTGVDLQNLTSGQRLCIPSAGSRGSCQNACRLGGNAYLVPQAETLATLATRLGVTQTALLLMNPTLLPQDFTSGQVICIPS